MDSPTGSAGARDHRLLRSLARRIDPNDAGAHNNLGVLYHNAGLHDDAVAAFMRAVELDPRMDVARRNFEVACLNSGRADQRVAELREALRTNAVDQDARRDLARLCALLGEHAEAVAHYTELLIARPADIDALIHLGLSFKAFGAIDEAFSSFQRALAIDPASSLLYFHLAEIEYNRGDNDRAIELLNASIERNQANHEAWYLLGFALGDAGRHEQAREAASRAMELHPDFGKAHANLSLVADPTARYVDKAMRDAARGAQVDANADAQLAHVTLGLAFRSRGYYAEALAEFEQAQQRGEDLDLVQQAMAELHLLRRDGKQAVVLFDALLSRHSAYPKLWNGRGVALHHCGRYVDALTSYDRALSFDADNKFALNNSGVARFHAGDHDGALECFTRALTVDPAFTKARLNQALLLYKGRRLQQAIEAYRAAIAPNDPNPVAWNGIGLVLADLGRHQEARTAYARAIEARPRYAEAHYNLSFALSNLGDTEGALRENKLAIEIEPYYVQQRFELALDLEFSDPAITVDTDLGADRRAETVDAFAFDATILDTLFTELQPSEPAALQAEDPFAVAAEYMAKGWYGEALERYREITRTASDNVPALSGQATALLQMGQVAEARSIAEDLAARSSRDTDLLALLGAARAATGDLNGALAALREARSIAPQHAPILTSIGDIARRMNDLVGARNAYRQALAIDANDVTARLGLARAHVTAAEWPDARREFEAVLRVDPTNSPAALELSAVHRSEKRLREALRILVELLERDLYHFDALMALGDTLVELRLQSDALIAYARVVRFDPGHLGARRAIKRIHETGAPPAATGTTGRASKWQ